MPYSNLRECVIDLEKNGHLVRVPEEVDPDLEMAEIHRQVFAAKGPAIFFEKVKGSPFPAVSNLFGTRRRSDFIFKDTLPSIKKLFALKGCPALFFRKPCSYARALPSVFHGLPLKVGRGPVMAGATTLGELPQIRCWPKDGGAYILLPQVYTENPGAPGIFGSNLGMYRVQISGNQYLPDREAGLHYQIHRHIGAHHHGAIRTNMPMRVSVFVGGPPAHSLAAAMYLPEGMPEVCFAGALAGRRFRYSVKEGFTLSADADFCLTGFLDPAGLKPEGPFGDHLGYYSLRHNFPVLRVEKIYRRKGAIWPFTVVGRPPGEDSVLAELIQEIAAPVIASEIPGIKAVHAVDAAGIHPLMLAVGCERYVPYQERKPQEILTLANAVLGYGPCSLSKYLMIVAGEDDPTLDVRNVGGFLRHLLERIDWRTDLHFQTCTTMDTLDYTGTGLNAGSKVVMAAAGRVKRTLADRLADGFRIPPGFKNPRFVMPGILAIEAPAFESYRSACAEVKIFARHLEGIPGIESIPLVVLSDDSGFLAHNLNNFLWGTFTKTNPSHDIYGVGSVEEQKHWGCDGPLIMDARSKPHHAPVLIKDPFVVERVKRFGLSGASLHGIL